jgi:hypothetical protein
MSAINTAFTGFDQSMLAFLVPLQPCHVLPAVVQPEKESVQPGARACRKRAEACRKRAALKMTHPLGKFARRVTVSSMLPLAATAQRFSLVFPWWHVQARRADEFSTEYSTPKKSAGQCRGSAAPVQKQCSTGFWARDLAKVARSEQGWRLTRQKQYGNNSRSNVQN